MIYRLVKANGYDEIAQANTVGELIAIWEQWQDAQCTEETYYIEDPQNTSIVVIQPKCYE